MAAALDALLRPARVALIGASGTPGRLTARPQAFLARHGFAGEVIPVNSGRDDVGGVRAWPSVGAVPGTVDHAYVLLDGEAAIEAVADCARAGVAAVSVLSDGFAEAGPEGAERQARLVAAAGDAFLLGPNSTGVAHPATGFACTVNAAFAAERMPRGRIAVLSQSGSMIGAILSRGAACGVGFQSFVSVGNEAAHGVGEIGRAMVGDPEVDGFALFLETVRRPEAFAAFAAAARAAGKPVMAYLVGRSTQGAALAASHTGAMAGGGRALAAFLRGHGVVLAQTFEGLVEGAGALPIARRMAGRPRTATVITTTGGGGGMVYDLLGARGVALAPMGDAAGRTLDAAGIRPKDGPLVDVTLAGARYEVMRAVVEAVADDPETGAVVVAVGSSAQFEPERAVRPVIDAAAAGTGAPVLVAPIPHAPEALRLLAEAGITAFRTPESCAEAVAAVLAGPAPHGADPAPAAPPAAALARVGALSAGPADEAEAGAVLRALGIAFPEGAIVAEDDAPTVPGFAGPYVLKALRHGLLHKTEVGGVRVGLAAGALAEAAEAMRARLGPCRLLVQAMEAGRGEAIIGYVRDPVVGPLVSVGLGGVLAELHDDAALRPAPVGIEGARAMIAEVRGFAAHAGWRGLPRADLEALAGAVAALSALAAIPEVEEAEINPLLLRDEGHGVVALDALVRISGPADTAF